MLSEKQDFLLILPAVFKAFIEMIVSEVRKVIRI